MRLSAFIAQEHNAQLLIDMIKLYRPYCSNERVIEASYYHILNDEDQSLFVASFNERHIAAVCIKEINQQLMLDNFAVRDITQQRGIGKFLLNECKQLAIEKNCTELVIACQPKPNDDLVSFLLAQGFSANKSSYSLPV